MRENSAAEGDATAKIDALHRRVTVLERWVRLCAGTVVVLLAGVLVAARPSTDDIIRTRGLVVVDAQGRERIVIGAPLDSVSTNTALAGVAGTVIFDTTGRVAVAVGQNNPAIAGGRVVRRIGASNGLNIYDPRSGDERGGIGAFASGRANMCLDYSAGKEAVCATVADDDSYSTMQLYGTPNEPQFDRVGMFLGADGIGILKAWGGGTAHTGGIQLSAGKGPPRATVYDSAGKVVRELAPSMR